MEAVVIVVAAELLCIIWHSPHLKALFYRFYCYESNAKTHIVLFL
jgi:hypothetical protein